MFGTTCATCRRIRMFLVIAAGLIVMIGMNDTMRSDFNAELLWQQLNHVMCSLVAAGTAVVTLSPILARKSLSALTDTRAGPTL